MPASWLYTFLKPSHQTCSNKQQLLFPSKMTTAWNVLKTLKTRQRSCTFLRSECFRGSFSHRTVEPHIEQRWTVANHKRFCLRIAPKSTSHIGTRTFYPVLGRTATCQNERWQQVIVIFTYIFPFSKLGKTWNVRIITINNVCITEREKLQRLQRLIVFSEATWFLLLPSANSASEKENR